MVDSPAPIRVLLADDQRLMREGLRTLLELEPDLVVVGEAADGTEAVARAAELSPDVVLMDVRMPAMDGIEATRRIVAADPAARVILLTTFDEDEAAFDGLRAGAVGYLLKAVSGAELAAAVRTALAGGSSVDPGILRRVVDRFARLAPPSRAAGAGLPEPLSEREVEVLRLIARGVANRAIAERLGLAEGTVKNHVTAILQKLGARDRTQAALRAREMGLV